MKTTHTLLFAFLAINQANAGPPTAGVAKKDISPPNGTPMAGYYSARGSEGVHDPLYAKAVVLEKDGTRVALIGLDLIGTTFGMVAEARKQIEAATGIPGGHVMISATHSHTGPILSDPGSRAEAFGGSSALAKQFMKDLPGKIAEAVTAADKARVPATMSHAVGTEENLAFNRRFHMQDGTVGWNAGKLNPKIVKAAGPVDPSVPVMMIATADKKATPLAVIVNFAMHLDTVGGTQISADYPYWLSKCLAAAYGDDVLTLFLLGTCGDVNHIDVSHARPQKGHGEAARIGTRLAAAVLKAGEHLKPAADGPLTVSRETVELPLAPVTPEDVAKAKKVAEQVYADEKPAPKFLDQVQAFKAIDVSNRLGKPLAVEVQVVTLGPDLAWVNLPGEIFVELGMAIKAKSPYRTTMIAELANGSIGYVPTKRAYAHGNYEVISARCAEGSGEKLVETALRHLSKSKK